MLKLYPIYKENNNGTWDATIMFHPYIRVKGAPCLNSAKEMLQIYTAEEMGRKRWSIIEEE